MDQAAQFEAIKAQSTAQYNATVRTIAGGNIVSGVVTYIDKVTGGALAQQTFEAVALTPEEAGEKITAFLTYGAWEKPSEALPLFSEDLLRA